MSEEPKPAPAEPTIPTSGSVTPPPSEDIDEGGTATEVPKNVGLTSAEIDLKGKGAVRLDRFTPEDIAKFGKGAVDSGINLRLPRFGDFAGPVPFDWNKGFDLSRVVPMTINDQGASLSCTGQAWSKYISVLNFVEEGVYVDFSAHFIYARTFLPGGGAWLFSGGDLITLAGVTKESTTPSYTSEKKPLSEAAMQVRDDRASALNEALTYRTKAPAYVTPNMDEMAKAIRDQHGMIFGFSGSNEGMVTGGTGIVRPPKTGEALWGHCVLGIGAGLINGKKYVKFINSWSELWGQFGYGYIGEDYVLSGRLFDGLTLVDLPNLDNMTLTEKQVRGLQALEGYKDDGGVAFWSGKTDGVQKTLDNYLTVRIPDKIGVLTQSLNAPVVPLNTPVLDKVKPVPTEVPVVAEVLTQPSVTIK